ncbi:MAG: AmmeMemoRadiSam system protein A [Gammaproteobacteria bacterium]
MTLNADSRAALLMAARHSIEQTLSGSQSVFKNSKLDPVLREPQASFVTLKRHGALRGCIGTLVAQRPLLDDVIHNARAAAFEDPRFPSLTQPELESLQIEISVLSKAESITAGNRAELLCMLKRGVDGLIVQEGTRRATFLPAVWKTLPDASMFYDELMQKAGLGAGHWSSALKFFRYHTDSFSNEEQI